MSATPSSPSVGGTDGRSTQGWHRYLPARLQRLLAVVASFMDGAAVLCIIVAATLVTIFLDDIRVSSFGPAEDFSFSAATAFFLALFVLELLLNMLSKPAYCPSWFLLLDIVSAFSLLPDIPALWNPIIGLREGDTEFSDNTDATVAVERIKRVSRTGSRLLKVLKFVKLIRLGRIAKLFEMAQRTLKERARQKRIEARKDDNTIHADDYTQSSQVGQSLSEQTIRNVVLLVLVMLFGIPLLQPTTEEKAEGFLVGELQALAESTSSMGTVIATRDAGGKYIVWDSPELAPAGSQVLYLNGSALVPFFAAYDPIKGQPFNKTVTFSPAINQSYLLSVVGPGDFPVALAGLTVARRVLDQQFQFALEYYKDSVLYLRMRGAFYVNDFELPLLFSLRTSEMRAATQGASVGVFSQRSNAQLAATYSMWRTFTTLMLLFIGAVAFDHNNKRMVIAPIERMVATIVQLQKNPLARAVLDNEDGAAERAEDAAAESSNNETGMLERTLQKLTGLLQIGFGDAGSRMIQKCMAGNSEGDLDPLVDGNRMLAIFGFCDIRRFTDATECLREDVMMYVNEIASIVHSHVSICDGHPNKNVGDAFLVMWRLSPHGGTFDPDDLFQLNEKQPEYLRPPLETLRKRAGLKSQAERDYAEQLQRESNSRSLRDRAKQASASYPPVVHTISALAVAQLSVLADKAVVAFLRIIVDLDASPELRGYENHPRIKAAFEDFKVLLGFGLHCGWAIEGPIGSRYKIDASYLSPHVNLSEALQDLTKLYGTPLLVSGEFYTLLSPYLKSHMRRVDVVKVAGRDIPMNLYAFDIRAQAMREVISRQTPEQYDTDADIDVVEFKSSHFSRFKGNVRLSANSIRLPTSPLAEEPLSPQSPHDPYADPLSTHRLFSNPSLNPSRMDFSSFTYSGAERERIHSLGPVATYHLVWNFRLSVLQAGIPYSFHDRYAEGLELYLQGDWPAAYAKMDECLALYPEDVPTSVIIGVMREHDFTAPPTWQGWHEA